MKDIISFLSTYGLSEKEIRVYLACLYLGSASATVIARRAKTKRPGTYLVLEELVKRGLVVIQKTKQGARYIPLNPKTILTNLQSIQDESEEIMPALIGMYRDSKPKPVVRVYEDYDIYDRITDEVREYVQTGKEALYFGNSEFFYQKQTKMSLWFKVMKNKRSHCREIICGNGSIQKAYVKKVTSLGNPNYQIRQFISPSNSIHTEFGIWKDTLYLFSGSGKELYTIVIEHSALVDTQRAIFEKMWDSLSDEKH